MRLARRAQRAVVAMGALAIAAASAGPAGAVVGPDAPPPFTASLTNSVEAIITRDDTLTLRVALEGGLMPTERVSVAVAVTEEPLTTPAQLDAFLTAPTETAQREVLVDAPMGFGSGPTMREGTLAAGASQTVPMAIDAASLGFPEDTWGVYGLSIEARVGDEVVWSLASPLTWVDTETPVMPMTVVASVSAPGERANALLQAASDPRVVLLVDPTVLTPEQRDTVASHEAYALPAGNLDLAAAAHAGSLGVVNFAVERSLGAQALPLMAVAGALDDLTIQMATDAGASAAILETRFAARPPAAAVATIEPPGDEPVVPVVLPHTRLSEALGTLSPSQPTSTATVVAEAALAAGAGLDSVVVFPGDRWVVDTTSTSPVIDALFDAPFIEAQGLAVALSDTQRTSLDLPTERLSETELDPGALVQITAFLERLEALQGATTEPSLQITRVRSDLLSSTSLAGRVDVERRDENLAAAAEEARQTLSAVAVTSGSQLNLVSSTGNVPVTVSNSLDVPVEVTVVMTSLSSRLVVEDQPSTIIAPGTEATVTVPVTAVSSGDVDVSVAVRGPEGQTLAVAETLHMRVRAEWGNALAVVLTVSLAALLLAGVWRTARRGRRDTRVRPTQGSPVAGDDSRSA